MDREQAASAALLNPPGRLFSLDEANRAIVLVRKIVGDIVAGYRELLNLRQEYEEISLSLVARDRIEEVRRAIENRIGRLNRLRDELAEIGVELKDYETGLVDFPAKHQSRRVMLCWKLGEEQVGHWHEEDSGFSGRRPIGSDFENP